MNGFSVISRVFFPFWCFFWDLWLLILSIGKAVQIDFQRLLTHALRSWAAYHTESEVCFCFCINVHICVPMQIPPDPVFILIVSVPNKCIQAPLRNTSKLTEVLCCFALCFHPKCQSKNGLGMVAHVNACPTPNDIWDGNQKLKTLN